MLINKLIAQLVKDIPKPKSNRDSINIPSLIHTLLRKKNWDIDEHNLINRLAKKFDINNKLFLHYSPEWEKISDDVLPAPWQDFLTIILYKSFLLERNEKIEKVYKRINVLLKSIEISKTLFPNIKININKLILEDVNLFLKSVSPPPPNPKKFLTYNYKHGEKFKIIPITVLFYEGPIARAYLETFYSMGLKPAKIIHLIPSVDIVSKQSLGIFLPKAIRKLYAAFVQKKRIHFWPNYIAKTQPELKELLLAKVKKVLNFSVETFHNANSIKSIEKYSQNIAPIMVKGLKDKKLEEYLEKQSDSAILFTGGGKISKNLLKLKHHKFIHIHPGHLPDIRGADCFLWSILVKEQPSASCFYMNSEFDMGNIIFSEWLPKISLFFGNLNIDPQILYRSIYAFIDPWIRAYALRILISQNNEYTNLASSSQNKEEGFTYHFMHPKLQKFIFNKN